jgi:hypothetical protein
MDKKKHIVLKGKTFKEVHDKVKELNLLDKKGKFSKDKNGNFVFKIAA